MNNFKKLLASAVALTMVTSVLPVTGVNAAVTATDDTPIDYISETQVANGKTVVNRLIAALTEEKLTIDTVTTTEQLTIQDEVGAMTVGEYAELHENELKHLVASGEGTDLQKKVATKLVGAKNEWINFTESAVNLVEGIDALVSFYRDGGKYDDEDLDSTGYTEVKRIYDLINDFDGFLNNLNSTETVADTGLTYKEAYDEYFDIMEAAVEDYQNEYYDEFAVEYINSLKETFKTELAALEDAELNSYNRSNLDSLKEKLETVTESTAYDTYGAEDEVVEIIDAIEGMIADMETVNEILDSSSDAVRGLRSVRSKVRSLAGKTDEAALRVIDTFTADDIDAVQAYVEEVVNEFYTYETRQRSSGRYYVRIEPTELAMYISEDDVNDDVLTILTTILDADERSEDTVYDVLLDTDTTVVTKADLIAIVEEAEGVELKWTYTTTEVDLVEDALDALDLLFPTLPENATEEEKAEFVADPYRLNAREERTLKAEQARLERIHSRMENAEAEIIVTKDWWVFENGQWVFYQDGRTVSNVWVADHNNDWYYAGANGVMLTNSWIARDSSLQVWYYVGADGKMVTNTVVDGCTIDANGVWHA